MGAGVVVEGVVCCGSRCGCDQGEGRYKGETLFPGKRNRSTGMKSSGTDCLEDRKWERTVSLFQKVESL